MYWQFWKPKHTVKSVAEQLAAGLRGGSIVLDETLDDEPLEEETDEGPDTPPVAENAENP